MRTVLRNMSFRLGFVAGLVCCVSVSAGLYLASASLDESRMPEILEVVPVPHTLSPSSDITVQLALNVVDKEFVGAQEDVAATLRMKTVENLFVDALSRSDRDVCTRETCNGNAAVKVSYFVSVFPATPDTYYFQLSRILDAPGHRSTSFEVRGPERIARLKESIYEDASRWASECADAIATRDRSPIHVPESDGQTLASTNR